VVKAAGFNFLISPSFGLTSQCSHINAGGGLMYCYKGTNITGERVVNRPRTQLNDALIASDTHFARKPILALQALQSQFSVRTKAREYKTIGFYGPLSISESYCSFF
jgi:hypothetical protein